jgi:hypothetical protein
MASDINGTVEGIQGNAVEAGTLGSTEDGYVLTWVNANSEWQPLPVTVPTSGLTTDYFTSSGTWTCPAGITNVLVIGAGGGGGGAGGGSQANGTGAGGGGGGSLQQTSYMLVTPGSEYTITIGAGGSGGSGGSHFGNSGDDGTATTIVYSSTTLFYALGGGGAGGNADGGESIIFVCGTSYANNQSQNNGWVGYYNGSVVPLPSMPGFGGNGIESNGTGSQSGMQNYVGGFSGGSAGANATGVSAGGGGGGGAGPQGAGGNGGNGSTGGAGSAGSNGGSNTAAGGGGGGSGNDNGNGGAGGNGGSGYLYIIY